MRYKARHSYIMKKLFILYSIVCAIGLTTACKSGAQRLAAIDFSNVQEYIAADDENYKVDSINGYSTVSAGNRIIIVPEEITKKEYERLLTDKYTLHSVAIDTNSALYAELDSLSRPNARHLYLMRGYTPDDEMLQEIRGESEIKADSIFYFPETKQYEFMMWVHLTTVSFMMTEDGIIDTTFMQSETRTYGTNRIFVGQEGHDCDYHGSLWFYYYDSSAHHMIPLCHYLDYRWDEDCDFNLCWISDNELLVKAVSNDNSQWGWVGGYKPTTLAPHGTPVYYKLTITLQ